MSTKQISPAKTVNQVLPSFQEILSNPDYGCAGIKMDPLSRNYVNLAIQSKSEIFCAEVTALIVNHMVKALTQRPLYDTYDMSTNKSKTVVYDFLERPYQVKREEFQALLKIFWFTYLGIGFSAEQLKAYDNFRQVPKFSMIMD